MAMANESGSKASTSGSSSADSYIGSFISLISKYEIRYEGVLYCLNTQDSTIGLKNVKSYGTEGRKKDGPQIPPNDKVYEYILFRGSDIKDLQVKSSPSQIEEQAPDDPAIIQSHYAGVPPSPSPSTSVGGVDLSESSHSQDTVVLSGRAYPPGGLASYQQSATQSADLQTAKITGVPSSDMPLYWQGYNGTSISISHTPELPIPFQPSSSMPSFPLAVQNPDVQACKTTGFTNTSESITPIVRPKFYPTLAPEQSTTTPYEMPHSLTSNPYPPLTSESITPLVRPKFYPTLAPEQSTTTPYEMPHSLTSNPYPPLHAASMNANRLINTIETTFFDNVVSGQSLPFSASSLLMPPPTLLTPDQLVQPRLAALSSTQNLFLDGNAMGVVTNPTAVHAAPLLPLPLSAQQSQKSSTQFNEEFDFTAMNEKFKKDEVWGYLGKATTEEDAEENAIGQSIGDKEGLTKVDAKPAYNKDEFFDTISCNSLGRGAPRNGHNRFSHRMRLDNETFGNFQQRHHGGYGGYGGGHGHGHGEHYMGRGSYNWGRGYGYGYGGRGRGGNMPFDDFRNLHGD